MQLCVCSGNTHTSGRYVVSGESTGSFKRQYKLEKIRFRTDIGRHWFTNRVVNDWNKLGRHVVSAESTGSFLIPVHTSATH